MITVEKSLMELMDEAFRLSLRVAYETITTDGHYYDARKEFHTSAANEDAVWGWCDGLMHKYYNKVSSGQCSVWATIDFDVAAFEESVKKDIAMMSELLVKLGPPKVLPKI